MSLQSILDVIMECSICGHVCRLYDAVPCARGGTGIGCPMPDCGGLLYEEKED